MPHVLGLPNHLLLDVLFAADAAATAQFGATCTAARGLVFADAGVSWDDVHVSLPVLALAGDCYRLWARLCDAARYSPEPMRSPRVVFQARAVMDHRFARLRPRLYRLSRPHVADDGSVIVEGADEVVEFGGGAGAGADGEGAEQVTAESQPAAPVAAVEPASALVTAAEAEPTPVTSTKPEPTPATSTKPEPIPVTPEPTPVTSTKPGVPSTAQRLPAVGRLPTPQRSGAAFAESDGSDSSDSSLPPIVTPRRAEAAPSLAPALGPAAGRGRGPRGWPPRCRPRPEFVPPRAGVPPPELVVLPGVGPRPRAPAASTAPAAAAPTAAPQPGDVFFGYGVRTRGVEAASVLAKAATGDDGDAKNPRAVPTKPAKASVDRSGLTRAYNVRLFMSDDGLPRAITVHEPDAWRQAARGRDVLLWDVDHRRLVDLSSFPDPEAHLPDFANSTAGSMRASQIDSSEEVFVSVVMDRRRLAVYTPAADGGKPTLVHTIDAHTGPITAMHLAKSTSTVFSASYDRTVAVHDAMSGTCVKRVELPRAVSRLHILNNTPKSTHAPMALTAGSDGFLRVFTTGGDVVAAVEAHTSAIVCMDVCGCERRVATGDNDGVIKVCRVQAGNGAASVAVERVLAGGHRRWVQALSIGHYHMLSSSHDGLCVWDFTPEGFTFATVPPTAHDVVLRHAGLRRRVEGDPPVEEKPQGAGEAERTLQAMVKAAAHSAWRTAP